MTPEGREQSQPPQFGNDERLQAIRQLQGILDPFRENGGSERTRAHGLNNLYLQMVSPSLDFIESVASSLMSMPYKNLEQLRFAAYDARENSTRFFAKHGIVVDNPEKLLAGISNAERLIDDIARRHSYDTGHLMSGEKLNPKAFAESIYEIIQIKNGERQVGKMVKEVKSEPDLQRRYSMGLNLKKRALEYIHKFSFTFLERYHEGQSIEPTWENLTRYYGWYTEIKTKDGGYMVGDFGIKDAVQTAQAAITRYQLEKKLDKLPSRNLELFEQLRFQYGAKAANLIILSELAGYINKSRKASLSDVHLAVPDFKAVSVDLHRVWKEGKLLDTDLQPYFEWVNGLKEEEGWGQKEHGADYIVRSSAVFSEDGENITGAGVYESVRVQGGATFQGFKEAVIKVYESTDSPRAQVYRIQHGIDREEMGLLIQKYIAPNYNYGNQSQEGYANSKLAGIPQLMEIVTRTSRNFIRRKELDFFLGLRANRNREAFQDVHHFPPDQSKIRLELPFWVAQLTSIVERIWRKDVQVEFVVDGFDVNFIQVRELPASMFSQAPEVKFPDEPPIHSGASIGNGDMKLPVLDDQANNSEKTGVVIIPNNKMFSMGDNSYRLPKKGAVIISDYDGENGHIQTLCAEKGLICLFPDEVEEGKPVLTFHELLRLKRMRIVSNGIEGRVYKVSEGE